MPSKYRSKKSYIRKFHTRDSSLAIIAVEGERTEVQYFQRLQNSRLKILVIPPINGMSAPNYIFDNLKDYLDKAQLFEDDIAWLLIDKDRWPTASISTVISNCSQYSGAAKIEVAVSNPCFETWLILHHSASLDGLNSSEDTCNTLRSLRGGSYNKSNCPEYSEQEIEVAIQNSKLNATCLQIFPSTAGTRIFQLVEQLKRLRY